MRAKSNLGYVLKDSIEMTFLAKEHFICRNITEEKDDCEFEVVNYFSPKCDMGMITYVNPLSGQKIYVR